MKKILPILSALLLVGTSLSGRAENWRVYDITEPTGSVIDIAQDGGMFGFQIRLTGSEYPDSLVVQSCRPQYDGFPNVYQVRQTGCSGPQNSGKGGTLCAYWFIVELNNNKTPYGTANLYFNVIGYRNGYEEQVQVSFDYTIRQTPVKFDPGIIGPDQVLHEGNRAEKLGGTPAWDADGDPISYLWHIGDGVEWTPIEGAAEEFFSPGIVTRTACYMRTASTGKRSACSNFIQIEVLPPLPAPNPEAGRPSVDTAWNHTVRRIPRTGCSELRQNSPADNLTTITYCDGFGRPTQVVDVGASPDGNDQVQPIFYDAFGRDDVVAYLPYVSSTASGNYRTKWREEQGRFYKELFGDDSQKSVVPRTDVRYDSPATTDLLRSWRGPGAEFRADGRVRTFAHRTNRDNEVLSFELSQSGLRFSGYCEAGVLHMIRSKDEDSRVTEEFLNHADLPVLRRCYLTDSTHVDTYYVYDDRDRLIYVLPPLAIENMPMQPGEVLPVDFIEKYLYNYGYTSRGLLAYRRIPGGVEEQFERNDFGLIVHKGRNLGDRTENFLYDYDNLGRLTRESVATACPNMGQGGQAAVQVVDTMAVYRYDTYPDVSWGGFVAVDSVVSSYDSRTAGYKTYEKVRIIDFCRDDAWNYDRSTAPYVERVFYYDRLGRTVQIVERMSNGDMVRYSTDYDWRGNVMATVEDHRLAATSSGNVAIARNFTYDHADRPLDSRIAINGIENVSVRKRYDRLGRLAGCSYTHGDFTFTDTTTYNIRGWVTRHASDYFEERLRYTAPVFGQPRYTGDIAEVEWMHGASGRFAYAFDYDPLSRLTDSRYYVDGAASVLYAERDMEYDASGNLLHLQRRRMAGESWDLTYHYADGRLSHIETATPAGDNPTWWFDYDVLGNQTRDDKNNLRFRYNYLNLLQEATDTLGRHWADYRYEWNGRKVGLRDPRPYCSREYSGSVVYVPDGKYRWVESIDFEGGQIVSSDRGLRPWFFVRDHVGSVRVIVDAEGDVVERNDYYPFGERWGLAHYPVLSGNRYRFNGKELQNIKASPYIDYGARMYDPFIGRWFSPDPLADDYTSFSPYAFCADNPVRNIDPDGRKWVDANGYVKYQNGSWTKYANANDKLLGKELQKTPTGLQKFDHLVNSPAPIQVNFNKLPANTYGTTKVQIENGELRSAIISLDMDNVTEKARANGIKTIEAAAATLGHEIRHTEEDNIRMQLRSFSRGQDRVDENSPEEIDANAVSKQIINEYQQNAISANEAPSFIHTVIVSFMRVFGF